MSNTKVGASLFCFISLRMLCRLRNCHFLAKKCLEQIQPTSKNLNGLINFQNYSITENVFIFNKKTFTSSEILRKGAEKLQEKQEPLPIEGFKKSTIKGIYLNEKSNILGINFGQAEDLEYPVVWLRDNCQCHECFDTISQSRVHEPLSFKGDVIPKTIQSNEHAVSIVWNDGHHSIFNKEWLCNHSFQTYHQMERLSKRHIQRIPWNAKSFIENMPNICFSFSDVIENDKILLKWLETLATVGVAKLSGAPLEQGQLHILAKRVAYIKRTHYGEEYFIKGDNDANNVAYKKGALQMHTDMPYYHFMPGVVLLHFIVQSPNGGENILTDGLNAIKHLPKRMYDVLANTLVDWTDIGFENDNKFYSIYRAPVLCEDPLGNLERVNWSQPQRDSVFNVSPQRALEWYEAFKEFSRILHDQENAAVIKNVEGDILTFDNRRVLHGRTDYTDGRRFLCGAFIDWDEIYSKIRILRQELN